MSSPSGDACSELLKGPTPFTLTLPSPSFCGDSSAEAFSVLIISGLVHLLTYLSFVGTRGYTWGDSDVIIVPYLCQLIFVAIS